MLKAYIITATARSADEQRSIIIGQPVYAAQFHWTATIGGAMWHDKRQDAVDIIAGDAHDPRRDYLLSGSIATTDWTLSEVNYEIDNAPIGDAERDDVIRRNALKRLSEDDRRVLGLNFPK